MAVNEAKLKKDEKEEKEKTARSLDLIEMMNQTAPDGEDEIDEDMIKKIEK